jgi:hypothetical protein
MESTVFSCAARVSFFEWREMAFEKRNHGHELRARLKELAARFGQAEIARRTDTPPANVHRYLREGKVPVDFCAALVAEFQVSPIWLIEGRGGMLRSDVRKPIADMGGDLLELVETMNAVSRMRIGAVAGSHDRKTLRELGDAMDAFDRLREKLNVHTRPLLQGVLDEWGEALEQMDLNRAQSLRLTARQLSRLTTDEALLEQLDAGDGHHAYLHGELEEAVAAERRVFARRLHEGRIREPADLNKARNLIMSVRETGRLPEALRLSRAILALVDDGLRDSGIVHQLGVFEAHLEIDLGDLAAGLDRMARCFAAVRDDHSLSSILYAYAHLLAGLWTFEQALNFGTVNSGKARVMTRFAATTEDRAALGLCLPGLIGDPPTGLPEADYDAGVAQLVLDLLRGRKRGISDYDKLLGASPPHTPSAHLRSTMVHLHRAQVARLARNASALKKESAACEHSWQAVPPELHAKIEWLLPHRRNLEAVPAKQRTKVHRDGLARVQGAIDRHIANGYRFLAG